MNEQDKKDLAFLKEMRDRLTKARNEDATQFDYVEQMIDDWVLELESKT